MTLPDVHKSKLFRDPLPGSLKIHAFLKNIPDVFD
jgi:hypothetical protein